MRKIGVMLIALILTLAALVPSAAAAEKKPASQAEALQAVLSRVEQGKTLSKSETAIYQAYAACVGKLLQATGAGDVDCGAGMTGTTAVATTATGGDYLPTSHRYLSDEICSVQRSSIYGIPVSLVKSCVRWSWYPDTETMVYLPVPTSLTCSAIGFTCTKSGTSAWIEEDFSFWAEASFTLTNKILHLTLDVNHYGHFDAEGSGWYMLQ